MLATVLSTSHKSPHSALTVSIHGRYQYIHVIGKASETEKLGNMPTVIQQISIRAEMKILDSLQTNASPQYAITISLV